MNRRLVDIFMSSLAGRAWLFGMVVSCFQPVFVEAQNWPQWRGEKFDNLAPGETVPVRFSTTENMLWKCPMPGPAGSSPAVWDGTCYVTSVDQDDQGLLLIAVGSDGNEKWRRPLGGENQNSRDEANSAAPSPITDGKHVWATSGAGVLACFDLDGREIWQLDLQEKFGQFDIQFGMSTTPIMVDGRLFMQLIHGNMRSRDPGFGLVVALDGESGEIVWQQNRETDARAENKHSYASPTLYDDGESRFLITHGGDFVIAHDLADGHELWRCAGLNARDNYNMFLRFVSSPVCQPGIMVVPSAKTGRVLALKPGGSGDITENDEFQLWRLDRGSPDVATPVIYDGLVFLFQHTGIVVCLDASNGEQLWEERMLADLHRSTPVLADGNFFITGRDGVVTVLKAGKSPEVVSRNSLGETITASPAIADGKIYVRTFENLYCFANRAPPSPAPAGR